MDKFIFRGFFLVSIICFTFGLHEFFMRDAEPLTYFQSCVLILLSWIGYAISYIKGLL